MRQILIDHARPGIRTTSGVRPGRRCSLDETMNAAVERPSIMLAIDDALCELERERCAQGEVDRDAVFGGLTAEESAEVFEFAC